MKIVFVSDTHLAERAPAFRANWDAVAAAVNEMRPDLVVHLGDISADGSGRQSDLVEARAAFKTLAAPIRFLPGNHDLGDNPPGPGKAVAEPVTPARLAAYARHFGADRWSLAQAGWRFIGLNAQLLGSGLTEEEEQFAWLAETLTESDGPLGLFLHKPLFRDGPADDEVHIRYVPAAPRARLLALLAGHDLRFVASGHAHQTRVITVAGVDHAWAPATSFCIPDRMQEAIGEKVVGIFVLTIEGYGHRFELVTPPGVVNHNLLDHPAVYPALAGKTESVNVAATR